jgi:hypothetical protein
MNINYKIVEVWSKDHLIVVRFWTDVLSEEFLASDSNRKYDGTPVRCRSDVSITLPIPAPTGEELDNIITRQAPVSWLKTLEDVIDPEVNTSMIHIEELLGKTFSKNAEDFNQNVSTQFDVDIKKLIESLNDDKK